MEGRDCEFRYQHGDFRPKKNMVLFPVCNSRVQKKFLQKILETEDGLLYAWYMSWKPPINRRANKNLLNHKRFFRLLSQQCNFLDEETAFAFYSAIVGLVGQELRRSGMVRLPYLGDFGLVETKPRPGWCGKAHVYMGLKRTLRFYPSERLRRYFAQRQKMQ